MQGIDLHTHSNISDGTLSPDALVKSAVECGIHTLALTDHDTMDGVEPLEKLLNSMIFISFLVLKSPVNGHAQPRKRAMGCILSP